MKRSPLRRTKGLRPRSTKKAAADKLRTWMRRQFLILHPDCERCSRPATDVHEIIRRSQAKDAALRPELYVALCRSCHEWATTEPKLAHDHGYVLWSWEDTTDDLEAAREKRRWIADHWSLGSRW